MLAPSKEVPCSTGEHSDSLKKASRIDGRIPAPRRVTKNPARAKDCNRTKINRLLQVSNYVTIQINTILNRTY